MVMVPLVSRNMAILKAEYGFDTVALRHNCVQLANLKHGAMALDVGTGSGWMAIVGAMSGLHVVSVDICLAAINRAQERANSMPLEVQDSIRYVVADGLALPFPDARFEGVFTFDAIHHLADNTCPRAIREMLRVCRWDGKVVLSDLSEKGLQAVNEVITRGGDEHECNQCIPSRIPGLLDAEGLEYGIHELGYAKAYVVERT